MTFLSDVANHLLSSHADSLSRVGIVLPNKRAELFLKTALSSKIKKPTIGPLITTIEELVCQCTKLQVIKGLPLLSELYSAHLKIQLDSPDTFDEFSKWGNTVIQDFNEVDRYCIDPKALFSNLRDAKVLERWGLRPDEEPTSLMENYIRFWNHLFPLYENLNQSLIEKGQSYQGMGFRYLAENLEKLDQYLKSEDLDKVYFVGFNAVNTCEEKIMNHLQNQQKASVLWDLDAYYYDDPEQEAGLFARKIIKSWKSLNNEKLLWVNNHLENSPKTINSFGVSGRFAQAQKVAQLIKNIDPTKVASKKVAIVLADESLLIPVLEALPSAINKFNITMGLPLNDTSLGRCIVQLITILEKCELKGKFDSFYYKDIIRLFEQPTVQRFLTSHGIHFQELIRKINKSNAVYTNTKTLSKYSSKLENTKLFQLLGKEQGIYDWLVLLNEWIIELSKLEDLPKIEAESFYKIYNLISQLTRLTQEYNYIKSFKSLKPFLSQTIKEDSLDFYGEPLEGLQILGILETRTLDFDEVIVVSVNEGILPKGKTQNSFIPHDLKTGFELPTFREKDAVFAYHFYRLIQRAEKVSLIYNTASADLGSQEPSRFLLQLEKEWPIKPFQEFTSEIDPPYIPVKNTSDQFSVEKTPELLSLLEEVAFVKGFSPSSLSTYLRDPLTFYEQRILRISELDEVEETIADNTLGSYIHAVLEKLYTPLLESKEPLRLDDLKRMKADYKALLEGEFLADFSKNHISEGKNHLIYKVAEEMISTFLKNEKSSLETTRSQTIHSLEKGFQTTITLGNGQSSIIKGNVDRIDEFGTHYRITDYKTGFVESRDLSMKGESVFVDREKPNPKALQLICYGLMFFEENPNAEIELTLCGLRNSGAYIPLSIDGKTRFRKNDLIPFVDQIVDLIEEILNVEIPFTEKANESY